MKKANPVVIGSFVIASIVLFVVGIIVFSSGRMFTSSHTVVAVFPGAVKGLQVGSPVEFRGVRIGLVKEIKLLYDRKKTTAVVPVYMQIDSTMIVGADHRKLREIRSEKRWKAKFSALIDAGLKAQLDMQSLVTGQMIVTLDFRPDAPMKMSAVDQHYPEIPTIPSIVTSVIETLKKIPIEELVTKLASAADGVNKLVNSQKALDILNNANLAILDARKLLASADTVFKSADDIINPDSPVRADFENALAELSAAARSLRILAEYLEQHPDSLIKGKGY